MRLHFIARHWVVTQKFWKCVVKSGSGSAFVIGEPPDGVPTTWLEKAVTCTFAALAWNELRHQYGT
jgi:hypothetical protein